MSHLPLRLEVGVGVEQRGEQRVEGGIKKKKKKEVKKNEAAGLVGTWS